MGNIRSVCACASNCGEKKGQRNEKKTKRRCEISGPSKLKRKTKMGKVPCQHCVEQCERVNGKRKNKEVKCKKKKSQKEKGERNKLCQWN